ncbi:MAG: hypothetical protein WCQ95_05610 [Bacteroidota bacterium]
MKLTKKKQKWILLFLILVFLFAFRLVFGLCKEFWLEDELQVYMIGLKFYTTGHYPYFGPDIVYTNTQIPGALQGLLVGLPFFILHIPEAPYILLNLLSMTALCLLALYFHKKFIKVPAWFSLIWLLTCPWALNYSTYIINPSYVLFGAILFFIGFFEAIPKMAVGFIKQHTGFLWMGFGLFWIFQLHMSWILLLPFIGFAFVLSIKNLKWNIPMFIVGCLISGSVLIPTYIAFGFHSGTDSVSSNMMFNTANFKEIFAVITRILSFSTYELPHFVDTGGRPFYAFLMDYPVAAPFIAFVTLLGLVQVGYLIVAFFLRNPAPDFKWMKYITLAAMLITWCSFFFSVKGPSPHTYYLLFPVAMMYSFYCWQPLFKRKWFTWLMIFMLLSGFITSSMLAHNNYYQISMYKNRYLAAKAVSERNYKVLGPRRCYDKNK